MIRRLLQIVILLAPAPAGAQRVTGSLDVGGAVLRYADSLSAAGPSLSPSVKVEWPNLVLGASAAYSRFAGGATTQGLVNASLFTPRRGSLLGELGAVAGGSEHQGASSTGQAVGTARVHFLATNGGGWLGVGAGRAWDGQSRRAVTDGEVGGWMTKGSFTLVGAVTPTIVDDSIKYSDALLSARFVSTSGELNVTGGCRAGSHLPTLGGTASSWGTLAFTRWLQAGSAVVVGVGTYPPDLGEGYPGGRFATIALRLGSERERPVTSPRTDVRAPLVGTLSLSVTPTSGGSLFRVIAPNAHAVELIGDFSQWQPLSLVRGDDGAFTITLRVPPGHYRANLRLDGGPWIVPPGLAPVTDEFGGKIGLLVVP